MITITIIIKAVESHGHGGAVTIEAHGRAEPERVTQQEAVAYKVMAAAIDAGLEAFACSVGGGAEIIKSNTKDSEGFKAQVAQCQQRHGIKEA